MSTQNPFLTALVKGNSKQIEIIYTKNFYGVQKFILQNKGTKEDAKDIFQKALLQIAVRYKKEPFTITTSFDGYLFTVCKNLWRRELNKLKKRVTNTQVLTLEDEDKDHALALVEQQRQELFVEKLQMISDNCKKILNLFFTKTSCKEIAIQLGYSTETVARQRVFKCKKKLTALIKEDKRYQKLTEL